MIDPDVPPPCPPAIVPQSVRRADGSIDQVVTILDAARLCGVRPGTVDKWIAQGLVAICYTPTKERRVFVASLWRALPIELRR